MARQNIDEEWKTDPRRDALIERLKDSRLADGARVQLNWLILDHKGHPVPLKKFKFVRDHEVYIECGLAEIDGDLVRIAGADRYEEFFDKQRANSAKGGEAMKAKAQKSPKKPTGSPEKPKHSPKSPSSSFSFSSSISEEKNNTYAFFDQFERLAKKYRETFKGTTTGPALPRFRSQVTNLTTVAEIDLAMGHYRKLLDANEWRQPKQSFATFLGTEHSGFFWREYITMPELPINDSNPAAGRNDEAINAIFARKAVSQ